MDAEDDQKKEQKAQFDEEHRGGLCVNADRWSALFSGAVGEPRLEK
jgi:hypothetical protein